MMRLLFAACLIALPLPALGAETPLPPQLQQPRPGPVNLCGTRPTTLAPVAATHTQAPYPAESQRLGEQGVTLLRVEIGPDGRVARDAVESSSGFARLDQAALDFVRATYRWAPTDCDTPVATLLRIVWRLQPAPSPFDPALLTQVMHFINGDQGAYPRDIPETLRMTAVIVILKQDNSVGQAVVLRSSGDAGLDAKAVATAKAHSWTAPRIDDQPQGGIVFLGVVWTPPGQTPPAVSDLSRLLQLFLPPAPPATPR